MKINKDKKIEVRVQEKLKDDVVTYCKKQNVTMSSFISELIKNAIYDKH